MELCCNTHSWRQPPQPLPAPLPKEPAPSLHFPLTALRDHTVWWKEHGFRTQTDLLHSAALCPLAESVSSTVKLGQTHQLRTAGPVTRRAGNGWQSLAVGLQRWDPEGIVERCECGLDQLVKAASRLSRSLLRSAPWPPWPPWPPKSSLKNH